MDPTACLNHILTALQDHDHTEAYSAAEDLLGWMNRQGFPPDFSTFTREETEDLTAIICFGVMAGCQVARRIQS